MSEFGKMGNKSRYFFQVVLFHPPLAPEFRTVNTCLNFVPKHT